MIFTPDQWKTFLDRGDFADVYLEESSHTSLRWEDGKLDEVGEGVQSGAGLRLVTGPETRYAHVDARDIVTGGDTAKPRRELSRLYKGLSAGLTKNKPPQIWQTPMPAMHAVRIDPSSESLEKKVRILESVEKEARMSPLIRQVTASYGERRKRVAYVNSDGDVFEELRIYVVLSVHVTAQKNGTLQTAYESVGGIGGLEIFDRTPPAHLARIAAQRAIDKLSAPPAPVGECPVVISSVAGGTLIHEAIGHALEADGIQEGTSPHFAGKIGQKVANDIVTVLDDPTREGHRGSFFFDDEGTKSERSVLVENGILKTYLYDRKSAGKDKRRSNGHGRRESFAHKPIPRMSNTFIAPGKDSPKDILASLKRGLLVTRMGGGQVNTATGDFVFEVDEGFWVEDGKTKHMVRGATLLGNGPEVLRTIDRVGSDIGWSIGTCGKNGQGVPVSDGVPTLRVPKLVVGGVEKK
jgi:TldD protein